MEEFDDVQDVLAKWDSPPLNSIHTKLKRVEELADSTHSTQTTLLQRLAWQEHALLDIQYAVLLVYSLFTFFIYSLLKYLLQCMM